jgi:23S rRNA pseudouridine1911/1915/1917 synthase
LDDLSAVEQLSIEDGAINLRPTRAEMNTRLDRFVSESLPELSRVYVQQLIADGAIRVDGVQRRAAFKMTPGQRVTVDIPPPADEEIVAEDIPLTIVYEDEDVLVIDKPAGLVVHPAPGHPRGTLVNALLFYLPNLSVGGRRRPGIIHRLDKDTSGLMVVAKTDRGRVSLVQQWDERSVEKDYLALVAGIVEPDEATIDAPIGRHPKRRQQMTVIASGRPAVTRFSVVERFGDTTLLDLGIETGRTHQIRVHCAFIGHPVIGDTVYGPRASPGAVDVPRQFLHAARLAFTLPGGRRLALDSPLPLDLQTVLASR